jgi:hypothetical protein
MLALLYALQRHRRYAAINIAGLAFGIACSLILGLYLRLELTYDRHFAQHGRIYRVLDEFTTSGVTDRSALTSSLLAPTLAADNPQIQAYTRFWSAGGGGNGVAIDHGGVTYRWKHVWRAVDERCVGRQDRQCVRIDRQPARWARNHHRFVPLHPPASRHDRRRRALLRAAAR